MTQGSYNPEDWGHGKKDTYKRKLSKKEQAALDRKKEIKKIEKEIERLRSKLYDLYHED